MTYDDPHWARRDEAPNLGSEYEAIGEAIYEAMGLVHIWV